MRTTKCKEEKEFRKNPKREKMYEQKQ